MRLRDEHLCTLTDFHIRDGLAVRSPFIWNISKGVPAAGKRFVGTKLQTGAETGSAGEWTSPPGHRLHEARGPEILGAASAE